MTEDDEEVQEIIPTPLGAANVYLLSYAFNQDHSCFVCGTTAGFRVYTTSPVAEVHRREQTGVFENRSVVLITMLFKTNIFAMVTKAEDDHSGQNKVQIYDDRKRKMLGELRSRNEVKGVCLRRDIIVMVCEYAIYVYTCDKLRVILHLTTNANAQGLCVVASSSEPWILCCPGQSTGAVRVQHGQDTSNTHVFTAHQTALAALALNASGTLVATASENGTVVKVFQCSNGQELYRLRRSARPAAITCLSFRLDDRFLGVASSSSTVHIFKLDLATASGEGEGGSPTLEPAEDPQIPGGADNRSNPTLERIASGIQKAVTIAVTVETVSDVVKGVMPRYFNDLRSFATFRIPDADVQATVDARSHQASILGPQVAFHKDQPKFFVLHYSGVIYECSFRPDADPSLGTQECGFDCATTWFAVRPDFKVLGPSTKVPTVAGGAVEDDEEAEEWQLIG
jgi:WD40 repeat protein